MSPWAVEVRDVSFAYNGNTVLEDVTFSVPRGEFLALLGPNGGGKTTLLKLLVGLLRPATGTIRLLGSEGIGAVLSRVGYVPQDTNVNKDFPATVEDVVLMGRLGPLRWLGRSNSEDRVAAWEALERMGLKDLARRRLGELSQGQRQRVLVARALATSPELLLLDEPTASVDPSAQNAFYELLRELNRRTTIIVVSHDLSAVSSYVRAVACVNGRLHYHPSGEITEETFQATWGRCPVELIAHGIPHRVLGEHRRGEGEHD